MGYVTASTGGRGGGPNVGVFNTNAPLVVKPEYIYDYETGLKSLFFEGRLQANIAAFVMIDHDYITTEVSNQFGHPTTFLGNAKRAVSRGIELDLRAQPIDGVSLFASFIYDDAYYDSFTNGKCPFELSFQKSCDLSGKPLALTPKFAMSAGGEYSQGIGVYELISPKPLRGYFGGDASYQTDVVSTPDDSIYSVIHPYALLNFYAGMRLDDSSWDFSAWVKNAANKHYFTALWDGNWDLGLGENSAQVGLPRTYGVTLRAKF